MPMFILFAAQIAAATPAALAPGAIRPGDCAPQVEKAYRLTYTLPDSPGRNLLLRDIVAAQNSRHEGDMRSCAETISEVLSILKQSGRQ